VKAPDDEGRAILELARVDELDDVGMPHARHDLRLPLEAGAHAGAAHRVGAHDLDGDLAAELLVVGPEHGAHAALSEEPLEAEAARDEVRRTRVPSGRPPSSGLTVTAEGQQALQRGQMPTVSIPRSCSSWRERPRRVSATMS
jgi:hypothetical protein